MSDFTEREQREIDRANRSGRPAVVFVHGLWLLASSWDRWRALFEERGLATLAPGWPDDPESVQDAGKHPERFAGKGVRQVADHVAGVIACLGSPPAIVGHSFGGLLAQVLAGRGLARATVAIDPAPFRGVLPLPLSALRAASPVLSNPLNFGRAVSLTEGQFRYAFANAVSAEEAAALYREFAVPAPGRPLFQAATANLDPWTEARVDTRNPSRGPLLILSGEKDHTVPRALAHAAFGRQQANPSLTEFREMPGRGHSLTIDSGWKDVAEVAFAFVERHAGSRIVAA